MTKATRNTILSMISAQPGITLANLLHHGEGVSTDDIYHLIANEEIYVNLTASPLVEAQKCLLFIDQLYEETYNAIILSQSTTNTIHSPRVELIPGITVLYSGKSLTITLVGETEVLLQTEEQQIVTLSLSTFDELVKQGKITKSTTQKTDEINNQVMDLFKRASFPDLMAANRRYHLIQPYLDGQPIKTNTPQERSLRICLRAYRQAQQKYGYGYLGILHFENKQGNRNRKLPQHILNLVDKFIIERYETKKQKGKQSVYKHKPSVTEKLYFQ